MIAQTEINETLREFQKSLDQLPSLFNLVNKSPRRQDRDRFLGETFAEISKESGRLAAAYLFRSQWAYKEPEWFDHRLHLLDPSIHFNDFWTTSADNVIRVLPYGGKLLDLCSGDGFYDYWFYRFRADVTAIEKNAEAFEVALANHQHHKINFVFADVLTTDVPPDYYDVVVIRGAIEHFSEADQQLIFKKSFEALKAGGYFCGDTPAQQIDGKKALSAHEHEWIDEVEMRQALQSIFRNIETWTLVSELRTTLFWRCRK